MKNNTKCRKKVINIIKFCQKNICFNEYLYINIASKSVVLYRYYNEYYEYSDNLL